MYGGSGISPTSSSRASGIDARRSTRSTWNVSPAAVRAPTTRTGRPSAVSSSSPSRSLRAGRTSASQWRRPGSCGSSSSTSAWPPVARCRRRRAGMHLGLVDDDDVAGPQRGRAGRRPCGARAARCPGRRAGGPRHGARSGPGRCARAAARSRSRRDARAARYGSASITGRDDTRRAGDHPRRGLDDDDGVDARVGRGPGDAADPGDLRRRPVHPRRRRAPRRGRLRRRRAGPVLALRARLRGRPRRGRAGRRRCSRPATSTRPRRSPTASPPSSTSPGCRRSTARPGVIGFCLGGTLAFGVAAADDPSVCVSYYGSGVPGMLDRARRRDAARRCSTSAPTTPTSRPRASRRWPPRCRPAWSSTSRPPATPSTTTRRRCSGTSRPPRPPGPRRWPSSAEHHPGLSPSECSRIRVYRAGWPRSTEHSDAASTDECSVSRRGRGSCRGRGRGRPGRGARRPPAWRRGRGACGRAGPAG